jgi:uncharacterized protein with PQ loop repeat
MPTMHGTGMHHHLQRMKKGELLLSIHTFLGRLLGHHDHEEIKRVFDKFISVVGLVGPIMTTPQIINIWVYRQTEGLAIASWSTYVMTSSFWLIYGILHKERAIILVNIAWILANLSVVTGILLFR